MKPRDADHRDLKLVPDSARTTVAFDLFFEIKVTRGHNFTLVKKQRRVMG